MMSRIVELKDKGPLVLRKADMARDTVAICRCGLSAAWPYCDGSHANTLKEEAGMLYRYVRNERGEVEQHEATGVQPGEADPRAGIPEKR